jgi:hypothetical protein
MPRYIDAEHFDCISWKGIPEGYDNTFDSGVLYMADLIDAAPTISPDDVRGVGTWLRKEKVRHNLDGDGDYRYECSVCRHSDEHNENVHVPFCWYCGARMKGVSENG